MNNSHENSEQIPILSHSIQKKNHEQSAFSASILELGYIPCAGRDPKDHTAGPEEAPATIATEFFF